MASSKTPFGAEVAVVWRGDGYIDEETYLAVRDAARAAYRRAAEMVAPRIEQALTAAAGQAISDQDWFALTEEVSDAYGDAYLDAVINAGAELGILPSDDDLLSILAEQEAAVEGFAAQMRGLLDVFSDDMLRQQVPLAEIQQRLFDAGQSPLNPRKADMFARTATNTAVNAGFESTFKSAGLAARSWITQRDDRVRESHAAVDRDVVPAGENFMVGGFEARFPGDPSLPIGLRINCRCILGWVDGNGIRQAMTSTRKELYRTARELNIRGRSKMNRAELQASVVREMCLQGLAAGTDCPSRFEDMNMATLLTYGRVGNVRGRYRMRKAQLITELIETFQAVATLSSTTQALGLAGEEFHLGGGHNQKAHGRRGVKYTEDGRPKRTFEAGDRPSIFDKRQADRWRAERDAIRDFESRNKVVQTVNREQLERFKDTYGEGIESVFPEGSVGATTIPFPSASRLKGEPAFDREAVNQALAGPVRLSNFDPRTLHASQPGVTREGVDYYLEETGLNGFRATGRTFADQDQAGNRYPVVYRNPRSGQLVILSGHHRATAALVQARPLEAIYVDPRITVIRNGRRRRETVHERYDVVD
jgi:hypothetical protein